MTEAKPAFASTGPALQKFVPDDMNGDGKSDLVWQDDGTIYYSFWTSRWYMNGPALLGGVLDNLSFRKVKGVGDFDGDHRGDLLLGYYTVSRYFGNIETWLTDSGGQYRAYSVSSTSLPTDVGAAIHDMNGDGTSDVVWRFGGGVSRWYMSGSMRIGGTFSIYSGSPTMVGVGDFDGNGRGDLLWTDAGFLYMWLADQTGKFHLAGAGVHPAGWNIAGVYDMDGDGKSDIVWRDEAQQQTSRWYMDGTRLIGEVVDAIGPEYVLLGIADFDGNGRGDLIWADAALSYVFMWLTDGNGEYRGTYARPYPAGWSLISGGKLRGPYL